MLLTLTQVEERKKIEMWVSVCELLLQSTRQSSSSSSRCLVVSPCLMNQHLYAFLSSWATVFTSQRKSQERKKQKQPVAQHKSSLKILRKTRREKKDQRVDYLLCLSLSRIQAMIITLPKCYLSDEKVKSLPSLLSLTLFCFCSIFFSSSSSHLTLQITIVMYFFCFFHSLV